MEGHCSLSNQLMCAEGSFCLAPSLGGYSRYKQAFNCGSDSFMLLFICINRKILYRSGSMLAYYFLLLKNMQNTAKSRSIWAVISLIRSRLGPSKQHQIIAYQGLFLYERLCLLCGIIYTTSSEKFSMPLMSLSGSNGNNFYRSVSGIRADVEKNNCLFVFIVCVYNVSTNFIFWMSIAI